MKIRIKGNTIRYRLTRSEVELLATDGAVSETTAIGGNTLCYKLVAEEGSNPLRAAYTNDTITISMPSRLAKAWAEDNVVGHYATQENIGRESLTITVEKDFVCMDETSEDQSDNYPNPKANG